MPNASSLLHAYPAPDDLVAEFRRLHNGRGLYRLSLWLLNAQMDAAGAADLLSEVVEGGLLGSVNQFRKLGQRLTLIPERREPVVLAAFATRLPRLKPEDRTRLANRLLQSLKGLLVNHSGLLIDGGTVSVEAGMLCVTEHRRRVHQEGANNVGPDASLVASPA